MMLQMLILKSIALLSLLHRIPLT